jgi:8-oxo-dGTP pyrophosphatase MutT (NUDIX family)
LGGERRGGGGLSAPGDLRRPLDAALGHPTVVRLADRLAVRAAQDAVTTADVRLAAVAAVLRVVHEPELLFIKRAEAVGDPWSGHMAFPGGRYETGDQSLLETAVRETREETAIDIAEAGQLLGRLDDLAPRSAMLPRMVIRPYVAIVHPAVRIVASHEVAAHFWVPLAQLRDPAMHAEHELEHEGARLRFPGYRVGPHVAWGLTERIVRQLLSVLDDR